MFAVSFGIARALESGHVDMISVLVDPIVEVVVSLGLGALIGLAFHWSEQFFYSRSKRLSISVTFVFLAVALSQLHFSIGPVTVGFSTLLVCMAMGTVFCNLCDFSEELMERIDRWTGPLMVLFFVLSGSDLDFAVFADWAIILVGLVYILFRSLGKILGARISAGFTHCEPTIQKYLGITLFPQAGVALGMVVSAQALGQEEGSMIRNIILFSVMIYELVGPMLTKMALTSAGEIREASADKKSRDRFAAAK